MISIHQHHRSSSNLDIYFGCASKGRLQMPYSLKVVQEKFPHTKVKLYHGNDLDIKVMIKMFSKRNEKYSTNCGFSYHRLAELPILNLTLWSLAAIWTFRLKILPTLMEMKTYILIGEEIFRFLTLMKQTEFWYYNGKQSLQLVVADFCYDFCCRLQLCKI